MTKYQYKSISANKLKCVQRKTQVHCGGGRASVPRNIASASSAGNSHDAAAAADDDNLTADDNHDQS